MELKINKTDAIKAYGNANSAGREMLRNLFGESIFSVKERIKTMDDVYLDNGTTQEEFVKSCAGLSPDEIAYRQIKLIAESLNEGWQPNWDDSNEYKYYPWFNMEGGSAGFRFRDCVGWYAVSGVGSRLCFKSRDLAEYAGEQFLSIYRDFMTNNESINTANERSN